MDAIAQSSGVSKATIYNHWANKEALLMDVMLMVNGLHRDPEDVDSGDVCRDLADGAQPAASGRVRRGAGADDAGDDCLLGGAPGVRRGVAAPGDGALRACV